MGDRNYYPLRKERKFFWLIEVGKDERFFASDFAEKLHWLRDRRNCVHVAEIAAMDEKIYLSTSRAAYDVMKKCVERVGSWTALHP